MSSWFPFEYRDVAAWREDGLPLSTPSNEAAKHLDAAIAQFALMDADSNEGGLMASMTKVTEADPDCNMAKILMLQLQAQERGPHIDGTMKNKCLAFKEQSKKVSLSSWEEKHLECALALSEYDMLKACQIWEDILVDHPKDMASLQMLYFAHLNTGRRRGLRDSVLRVIDHYPPYDRYYGNLHGKLCFGYEENNQFDLGFKAGTKALEHTPKDIWAIHAMSHVYHETGRSGDGISFLERVENDWVSNPSPVKRHVWWHKSLYYFDLGDYEEAISLYDATIKPLAFKEKMAFSLSDAASLLLRLQTQDAPKGVDLKERWCELGQVYKDHMSNSIGNVFYDFHPLVTFLFGDNKDGGLKLQEQIQEQARSVTKNKDFNCMVANKVGVELAEATIAYSRQDYSQVVEHLNPIRYDVLEHLGGSHAQKDVIHIMLLDAAQRSGQVNLAKQLLAERLAWNGGSLKNDQSTFNERMAAKMSMVH